MSNVIELPELPKRSSTTKGLAAKAQCNPSEKNGSHPLSYSQTEWQISNLYLGISYSNLARKFV